MFKQLSKQSKERLFLVILMAAILPLSIYATGLIQDLRKQAAGSYEVGLYFSPNNVELNKGDDVTLQMVARKEVSRQITISGVQSVIYMSNQFTVNNVSCLAPFDGLPFVKIDGLTITIFCAISTAAQPVTVTTTDLPYASLDLTVKPDATEGITDIYFYSTRVTETGVAGEAPDVSTGGAVGEYTIVVKDLCPRGDLGNLDCSLDGCIDTADFELFRQDFGKSVNELNYPPEHHTPDLYPDVAAMIDTADYEILRANFGSCQ